MDEQKKNIHEAGLVEATTDELQKIFGDSGTARFSGYFVEEFNAKWRDSKRVETVEEMRRGDGAVRAVLNAIKSPILSTEWNVFSYDTTPKGEEIRLFVEQNIFNMRRSWREFLRESLAYLDFGHYAFELIFEIRDGMIHLVDLEPRIPASIQNWEIKGPNGKCYPGITQWLRTMDSTTGGKTVLEIPMEKLLVLTNEMEGDDITGQSVLRAGYIHWKNKNVFYKISGIAMDRYGVGFPVVNMPADGYGEAEKALAEEMAANIRSSEKGYAVLPPGFELKIVTPDGNPMGDAMDKLIEHHNRMIMMATLSQFLALGSDGTGSMALSRDHSSFFLQHVEDKAHYFAAQFTEQVIKRLVILNFGEQEWYPELKFIPLGDENLKEAADTLNVLSMAGLLKSQDVAIQQYVRQRFKLPELTDEQVADEEAEEETEDEATDPEEDTSKTTAPATPAAGADVKIQQQGLNGAQVAAILQVIESIKSGVMPVENAKSVLQVAFPFLTPDVVDEIVNGLKVDAPAAALKEILVSKPSFLAEQPLRFTRKLTQQEQRANMKMLNEQFNALETDLEDELSTVTGAEIDRYADAVKKKLDAGDIAGIAGPSLMLVGSSKKAFDKVVKEAFEQGKKTASNELGVTRPSTPMKNINVMKMDIDDYARMYVYSLEQSAKDIAKNLAVSDASTAAVASAIRTNVKNDAAKMINNISGMAVGQYMNRGRNIVFQTNLMKIKSFQRSEVLDLATCETCLALDGRVVGPTDPMAQMDIVHTHCRGLWVPIYEADDEQPDITGIPKSVTDSFDLVDGRPTVNAFKQIKRPTNDANKEAQKLIRQRMGV